MIGTVLRKALMDATGHQLDPSDVEAFTTLLRARGWKLNQREPTQEMVDSVEEIDSPVRSWELMWDECE